MRPAPLPLDLEGRQITGLLGPTNTGKTWRALQRMLRHRTGMIGLPLRLLAREVYDGLCARVGSEAVALLTGEERRVPAGARYWVCTTESMPLGLSVDFVAVDEVQLAEHEERGHVFTDRLLRARGARETVLMGSDTMAPMLRRLVPHLVVERRERSSRLSWAGSRSLKGLPPRTAVVAFSAAHVYELAERLRAAHGGTAVVLGALSPRTRNAQMAMVQSGEVPVMVATDAIGMGLNMDLDHVAFAGRSKFDGRRHRELTDAELAQIAGRAGRWKADGTFGQTAACEPFTPAMIEAIERHQFPDVQALRWRNAALSFDSLDALARALAVPPPDRCLVPFRDGEDQRALAWLVADDEVRREARGRARVELLWEVCCVPDFQKSLTDSHLQLQRQIFLELARAGRLDEATVAGRVARLDDPKGDVDTLVARLAWIRTWTYVSHRPGWLDDATGWQERTRAIEDRLSDALHDCLTRRFVELRRYVGATGAPARAVGVRLQGERVLAGGLEVARLNGLGLDLAPGPFREREWMRQARASVVEALRERAAALVASSDDAFAAGHDGRLTWRDEPVARLTRGAHPLEPEVVTSRADLLAAREREEVRRRLQRWVASWIDARFGELLASHGDEAAVRAVAFRLARALGTMAVTEARDELAGLDDHGRRSLARRGIRVGSRFVYATQLLVPQAVAQRAMLYDLGGEAGEVPAGAPWQAAGSSASDRLLALGYARLGPLWVRVDHWETVAAGVRSAADVREATRRVARALELEPQAAGEVAVRLAGSGGGPAGARAPGPGPRRARGRGAG